ncbi:hypothetical protein AMECASPLE_039095, partial [Ameca splendens]
NSSLYETIQTRGATGNERSHHPEEGSDYVNVKPGRWSSASTDAAVYSTIRNSSGNEANCTVERRSRVRGQTPVQVLQSLLATDQHDGVYGC